MGSSKKQTVGYKYSLGMHQILTHGPADKLLRYTVDGRVAWAGSATGGSISVNVPSLFGGEGREGGISGTFDLEMGNAAQGPNDYLQTQLGDDIPSFRGVVGIVQRQMYLGNNPYLKRNAWLLQRIHVRQDGVEQWYDEKAAVPNLSSQPISRVYTDFVNGFESNDPTKFQIIDGAIANANNMPAADNSSWWGVELGNFLPTKMYCEFRVISAGSGDPLACALQIANPSVTNHTTSINPRTELVSDPLGRPNVNYFSNAAGGQHVYDTALDVGVWYSFETSLDYGAATQNYVLKQGEVVLATGSAPIVAQAPRRLVFQRSHNLEGTLTIAAFRKVVLDGVVGTNDMNPAHIIRECLTDPLWGMGYNEADIDDVSFTTAADQLFAEGMGMSLLWDRQMPIEQFVQEVVKHINAALYVGRRGDEAGKFVLRLIRDDYDEETLPLFDESNVEKFENYKRAQEGELTNSVTVNYWDAGTGKTASTTAQDPALIQQQGAVINTTIQYPGFTNQAIADRVALRDLRTLSTPLASGTLYTGADAKDLNIGDVIAVSWEDYGLVRLPMRVTGMTLGDGKSNKIKLTVTQDGFAMPAQGVVTPPDVNWEDPSQDPLPILRQYAEEMPYYEMVQQLSQSATDNQLATMPDSGVVGAAGSRPQSGAINARLLTDPAGDGYEDVGVVDFSPSALLAAPVDRMAEEFELEAFIDATNIQIGSYAKIGNEYISVVARDGTTLTVKRAVLDTVPIEHEAGETIFFSDPYLQFDASEYVASDIVNVKLLTVAGLGTLSENLAVPMEVELVGRAVRPYPPGNFKVNDEYYPVELGDATDIVLTWAHRDRKLQTGGELVGFKDGNVGPEPGVTYTVTAAGVDSLGAETEFVNESGITGTTFTIDLTVDVPPGDAIALVVRVFSVRDTYESLYKQEAQFSILSAPYGLIATFTE